MDSTIWQGKTKQNNPHPFNRLLSIYISQLLKWQAVFENNYRPAFYKIGLFTTWTQKQAFYFYKPKCDFNKYHTQTPLCSRILESNFIHICLYLVPVLVKMFFFCFFLTRLPLHARRRRGKKKKRLMAFLIPWYSHKKKPKMSSSLKKDFISAVILLFFFFAPSSLSWTQAQFYLTTLIKTRTSVQSRCADGMRLCSIELRFFFFFRTG